MKYLIAFATINRVLTTKTDPVEGIVPENYMETTLNNLFRATKNYNDYKVIIQSSADTDNNHIPEIDGVDVFIPEKRMIQGETLLLTLKKALEYDCKYILFCEDDVDFSNNFLEFLDGWTDAVGFDEKDIPVASLFDRKVKSKESFEKGILYWEYPIEIFQNSHGVLMKKNFVEKMVENLEKSIKITPCNFNWMIKAHKKICSTRNIKDIYIDTWIAEMMRLACPDMIWLYGIAPSLVQHIGLYSAIFDKKDHRMKAPDKRISISFKKDIPKDYIEKGIKGENV